MTALDQSTKQRIVGILVILIAAIVLLPVVFDGQGSYQAPLESRIPEPAPFPVPEPLTPERPVVLADTDDIRVTTPEPVGADTGTLETDAVNTQTSGAPVPSLDVAGLAEGWSVRLASFSNDTNARNLLQQLEAAGHRAYAREMQSSAGQTLTAIYVGPGVDRAAMQSLQRQLLDEFQLSGMVVRYEIEDL